MNEENKSPESNNPKGRNLLKWTLGIIFLISALSTLLIGSYVSFWCWLLASLLVLPPVTIFLREKHKFHIHASIKAIGLIVLVLLAFMNLSAEPQITNDVNVADTAALSPTDAIKATVSEALGYKTNIGKPVVTRVEITKYQPSELKQYGYKLDADISYALIEINSSENLTTNLQKGTMNNEAVKTFQSVFSRFPNIGGIILWSDLPIKDKYGNIKNDTAIVYSMARPLYEKVNWTNFSHNDLPQLLKSESKTDDGNGYVEKIKF